MSVWSGIPNGMPTEDMPPDDFVPNSQDQYQWPKWGQHNETGGEVGEAPETEDIVELLELRNKWQMAGNSAERRKHWERILDLHAEKVYSIGTVCGVPQPVVVHEQLRNVPKKGIYNWNPGAFFGVYQPDTFWFDGPRALSAQ